MSMLRPIATLNTFYKYGHLYWLNTILFQVQNLAHTHIYTSKASSPFPSIQHMHYSLIYKIIFGLSTPLAGRIFSPSSNILCTMPNQKDQTPSLIISKTLNRPLTKTLNKVYVRLSHIWALLVQSFNKINFFDLNLNDNPHCSSRFSMKQTPTKKTTPMAEYHLHHIARFKPWAR